MTPDATKLDVPLGLSNPLHHKTVNNQRIPSFGEKKGGMRKRNIRWSTVIPPGPPTLSPLPCSAPLCVLMEVLGQMPSLSFSALHVIINIWPEKDNLNILINPVWLTWQIGDFSYLEFIKDICEVIDA